MCWPLGLGHPGEAGCVLRLRKLGWVLLGAVGWRRAGDGGRRGRGDHRVSDDDVAVSETGGEGRDFADGPAGLSVEGVVGRGELLGKEGLVVVRGRRDPGVHGARCALGCHYGAELGRIRGTKGPLGLM